MRQKRNAPVDSMGVHKVGDIQEKPENYRYHILVGALLSSQTRDTITYSAVESLKKHGLTPQKILETPIETIESLISKVGFYKRKSVYLKKVSEIIINKYKGDIPSTSKDLMKLPGIGVKMTNLIMQAAWNKVTAIITVSMKVSVLGIINTKTPEESTKALDIVLPKEYWEEVNSLLVGFGQKICRSPHPLCRNCLNHKICPASEWKTKDIEECDIY